MKAVFQAKKCMWQLAPEVEVPALEELSVCVQLCLTLRTKWTAFAYKAPGISFVELGLEGDSGHITALLFGYKWPLNVMLSSHHWHSVCLTWSARSQKLRVYVNGTSHLDLGLNPSVSRRLAPNGTLTLGVPHSVDERGAVRREDGRSLMGDIGLFRMWATAWRAEDLAHLGCEEGDVVRWDTRHWSYHYPSSCPPKADQTLRCDCHENPSLWGMKAVFQAKKCMWQLAPEVEVPALEELSVCVRLCLTLRTKWTAFAYKAPGISFVELGLEGDSGHITALLFGYKWPLDVMLSSHHWHSVCLTWSARSQKLRVYVNGTSHLDLGLNPSVSRRLAPNGTLTLGVPHSVDESGAVRREDGRSLMGDIGLFRMWATAWRAEDLAHLGCEEGDVVRWDTRHWSYHYPSSCPPKADQTLRCDWSSYKIQMWAFVTHSNITDSRLESITRNWMENIFSPNISVQDISVSSPSFCSTVHVDVSPEKSVEQVQAYITERLTATMFSYDSLTLMTDTDSLSIQPVVPERCPEEALKTIYGVYSWPKTLPQSEQVMICEEPAFRRAYRFCKLDFNDTAIWAQPNMTACKPLMIITDLDNVTVTADNAAEVVQIIKDLINVELGTANGGDGDLSASDMVTVVEKLDDVVDVAIVTPILSTPALALSMNNVQSENFRGMTFSVSSYSSGTVPEIVVNRSFVDAVPGTVATIALPPELRNLLDTDIMDGAEGNWTLNSYVISASINNGMVRNLKPQRVAVTLGNDIAKQEDDKLMCVFWDFSENDGQGGWNSQGCETQNISRAPVSEKDSEILTVISYLGCGISSSFLGITLITYMAFGKLRRDYPSKILINLSVALLALNLLYLLNTWLSSFGSYGLCIATAALLHYSLLASFTWMGLEALNMYFALVRVFNVYVPSYILKFCAVGWGVPLVIVGLVLATDVDAYGNSMSSDVHFYVTVAAFIMLILLGNVGVFVVVLIQIRRMQANKPGLGKPGSGSSMQDLRAAASLTFLLGLTWLIAFLSFGPGRVAMLYLFCIFNSLQGFFIFLFHCLLKENVRKQWIMHLTVKRKDSSVPENCPEEALMTIYGLYSWPETLPQSEQVMICEEPAFRRAYRFCKLDLNSDTAIWAQPNMTACKPRMIISDLDNVTVTADNAAEVVQMIKDLINLELGTANGGDGDLSASDMVTVVEKLDAVSENFRGMTFSVSSYSSGTVPEIVVNRSFVDAVPGTVATIALPPELRNLLDTDITDGAEGNWTLNSYVISASINNGTVRNLQRQRVAVTLGNDRAKQEDDKVMCVFWDFSENGSASRLLPGNWLAVYAATSCLCDHLTSFAVLLNISRAPVSEKDNEILTVISYLGCGISSIFLGITLITYTAFGKLRRDYPSKILINLSVALLALNLLYLLNTWLSSFGSYGLCIATAALLHYSLLASFTWMGLEALNMYFALVKVFNVYVPSYILKFCAVGWGVPLVIVGLVLATDVDAYGNSMSVGEDLSEPFCWIQSDVHFYVTVAAFIMLILLGNVGVFVVVLIQIRRMQANKPGLGKPGSGSSMQDLRAAASLTFLLGLTWLIAFLSFGPGRVAMLYLFCIFNSLQGFFIFLFHCLLKENVRKQWIMHLTFKRKDSSEWSLSFTASGQPKQRQEGHSHSMRSVDTSTMLKVSDSSSSTESGPIHHQRE
ncbi:hypothetical protein NHX12_011471 [Muraenolepis orangiensis]|uniref:Adhesion G-protein coupled receptor G4 n=1 Tax=Muraenolepis orangiensis TaxID=630683 RepID=A0A9Q0I8U0_9TELE|nr:hypothetical protein NHX12_011471 [Muraenolepis orangiensis]